MTDATIRKSNTPSGRIKEGFIFTMKLIGEKDLS